MTPNRDKLWSPADDARLFDADEIAVVAARLGRTTGAVRQRRTIVRRRMAGRQPPPRPSRAKAAVSTAQIVELRAGGLNWSEIAARVNLTAPACRARWQAARIAELERQNAELVAALAVHEERIAQLRAAWWGLRSFDPFGDPDAQQHALDEAIRALIGET